MGSELYTLRQVLVFRTEVDNLKEFEQVKQTLNQRNEIFQWSVDLQDIDKVLRIESDHDLSEDYVIELLSRKGVSCSVMTW